ncbi:hypothetical protein EIP91_008409 [Steccherinum ochraceum]|uniref:F-box domain-containing protein n=1 Tax=Steccherinum ochraceum TaxID=92696 RepID=A0A4R0R2W4_9APHY|nr:hypothetical protein EIP91_008409 [Steccherinum ochraceum]
MSPSQPSMDSQLKPSLCALPLEILFKILSHACTDDGATGRVLTLTCKSLRELCLSASVDIQSVGVDGVRRMDAFLAVLKSREEGTRRAKALRMEEPEEDEWEDQEEEEEERPPAQDPRVQVTSILNTISSSHLLILSHTFPYVYSQPPDTSSYPLLPLPHSTSSLNPKTPTFPYLCDLTLHGPFERGSFEPAHAYTNYAPRLKRFALSGYAYLPPTFGQLLHAWFPALEELWLEVTHSGYDSEEGVEETVLSMAHRFCGADDQAEARGSSRGVHFPLDLRLMTLVYHPTNSFAKGTGRLLQAYAAYLEAYVRLAERVSVDAEVEVEIHRFPTYKPGMKDSWNHIDPRDARAWLLGAFGRFFVRWDNDVLAARLSSPPTDTAERRAGLGQRKNKRRLIVYISWPGGGAER